MTSLYAFDMSINNYGITMNLIVRWVVSYSRIPDIIKDKTPLVQEKTSHRQIFMYIDNFS
jgi:hypothetical protein